MAALSADAGGLALPAKTVQLPNRHRVLASRPAARMRVERADPKVKQSAFKSFWIGGCCGRAASPAEGLADAQDDYRRMLEFQIRTVREDADWSRIERSGKYEFCSLDPRAHVARKYGVQIVWTLFGRCWPEDIDLLSGAFVERFARYAAATAEHLAERNPCVTPVFAPINEISFRAWSLFSSGLVRQQDGCRAPMAEIKRQLVRACIAACEAILSRVKEARFLHADPLEHVVAPLDRFGLARGAARRTELQFEAWDMIAGKAEKELGGKPRYLDLIGVNYYAENQWELGSGKRLAWQIDDVRRLPLSTLLKSVHARYRRPIAIAETGHTGVRRGPWIREIANEVRQAKRMGIPVEGICLHPMVDQRDERNPGKWLLRGLWEVQSCADGTRRLELSSSYASALRAAQKTTGRPARKQAVLLRQLATA
jgi:hypothetical protein